MRFVALKSEAQLDVRILHRARDRLVGQRTALMNQMRSLPLERGITIRQGRHKLQVQLVEILSDEVSVVSARIKRLLEDMQDQWRLLDQRIASFDDEFAAMARIDPAARRLATIPGIGVLNGTALVAAKRLAVGATLLRGSGWYSGRRPPEARRLLGITKWGSKYLRKLLIQGTRAAMPSLSRTATPLGG